MAPIMSSFVFLAVSGILLILPGFLLLRAFFPVSSRFQSIETLLYSFAISVGFLDFLMIALGRSGIPFDRVTLASGIVIGIAALSAIPLLMRRFAAPAAIEAPAAPAILTRRQGWIFLSLIALTILIKTVYLAHAVLPTATDLGHHMYWSKLIAETGQLPFYAKEEIVTGPDGTYAISDPQPIADFIIGEHLPFAAIAIFSGASFFSAFPIVFLFFINLLALLAMAAFAFRLAAGLKGVFASESVFNPGNAALAALFVFGPIYSLASPQAKFVSGGVVGNTLGNLFLPLILLALYRALKEKRPGFLALGFFLTFTLAYTHHLSTLMLIFTLAAAALLYVVLHSGELAETFRSWTALFLKPGPLLIAIACTLFFFSIAMPTYIETHAVGTALGTPTKTTRTGLSFAQISSSNGEARVAIGLAALAAFILISRIRRSYAGAFLIGWSIILLIMTMRPGWLFIDIPSARIGAYLSFPLGLSAAFGIIMLFAWLKKSGRRTHAPTLLFIATAFAVFIFAAGSGSYDNSQTLLPGAKSFEAAETFAASRYLADRTTKDDIILKDHNYLSADAWIKLFFMRDYSYPFSRGFFKRYEDNPDREQCTLLMISVPNTPQGEKCYDETGTSLVMVNPAFDTAQFEKSDSFSRIYASELVDIYKRK